MMMDWTLWASFLVLGNALALLATYLLCRAWIEQARNRIVVLEREMDSARTRDQAKEKMLAKIMEAVTELRGTTEDEFGRLRGKIDELIAQGIAQGNRSAA